MCLYNDGERVKIKYKFECIEVKHKRRYNNVKDRFFFFTVITESTTSETTGYLRTS